MNTVVEHSFSEEDKIIAGTIASSIKNFVSITAMREHTELLKKYPKITQIPYSLIGVLYVFFVASNSNGSSKDYFIKHALLVRGIVKGKELFWLELNGWYIYADGLTRIDIGSIEDIEYEPIEFSRASDIYDTFFKEDSRIPLFKKDKA